MPQIALDAVSVFYGDRPALADVTLSFRDKETTAVIGPSGSGKSTLLQLINGLVRASAGTVRVFEEPVHAQDIVKLRRRIGYAVQGTGLFPHMTVLENITLLAKVEGWKRARREERAWELVRFVGLEEELAGRYPFELSGGQRQRVGLCRAMMLDPPVFLFDEPFGALDPITRADIHREFLHIQEQSPRTTVLVTHDLREAIKLAHHIVIINEGVIVQQDASQTILDNPATEFVREFIHDQMD